MQGRSDITTFTGQAQNFYFVKDFFSSAESVCTSARIHLAAHPLPDIKINLKVQYTGKTPYRIISDWELQQLKLYSIQYHCKMKTDGLPTIVHVYDVLQDPVSRHVIVPVPVLRLYPMSHD